jgi:hypothetical protein
MRYRAHQEANHLRERLVGRDDHVHGDAMLATRINLMPEIATLSERVSANVDHV